MRSQKFYIWTVTKIARKFPNNPFRRGADTRVAIHAKCSVLLSDFKENFKVSTYINKSRKCQISWQFAQLFSSYVTAYVQMSESNKGTLDLLRFETDV